MKNVLRFNTGKILSLNNTNDLYIEIEMIVLSSDVNLNKSRFNKEFIDSSSETIVNQPLQVDKETLENGEYLNLTHKFTGEELLTDSVGTYTSYRTEEDEDGYDVLIGTARVWKRYPNTVDAIIDLYNRGMLKFSVEVLVEEQEKIDGISEISKGQILGVAIVSYPAEPRAVATLLVAEAYIKDLENQERSESELANKKKTEVNELSFNQIFEKIWNTLGYDYYIYTVSEGHVMVYSYDDGKDYALTYSVSNNEVSVDLESKKSAKNVWQIEGVDEVIINEENKAVKELKEKDTTISEINEKIKNLETEISELKTEKNTLISEKDALIAEKDTIISEKEDLSNKIKELETAETLSDQPKDDTKKQAEAIIKLNNKVQELEGTIKDLSEAKKELDRIKDERVQKELAEKRESLKETAIKSKCFSEEELEKDEELLKIFEDCDEDKLMIKIAQKVIESINEIKDEVVVETAETENILPEKIDLFND